MKCQHGVVFPEPCARCEEMRRVATAARRQALEEAAKIADDETEHGEYIASAIRALIEKESS